MRLQGKTVLVTGAAGGIGQAACSKLLAEGARVAAVDMPRAFTSPTTAADLWSDDRISILEADVTSPEALTGVAARVKNALGSLDGLYVNAAILRYGTVLGSTPEIYEKTMAVNVTGAWNTVRAFAPLMVDRGSTSIVITSSVGGFRGSYGAAAYTISKHAVLGLMRSLARELGPRGVRVNSVHPSLVDTPMTRVEIDPPEEGIVTSFEAKAEIYGARHALPVSYVEPQDIANAVAWLLSDEARYVSGITLPIDAGMFA